METLDLHSAMIFAITAPLPGWWISLIPTTGQCKINKIGFDYHSRYPKINLIDNRACKNVHLCISIFKLDPNLVFPKCKLRPSRLLGILEQSLSAPVKKVEP